METKKNHFDLSLPHSIDSYIKELVHHAKHPGKVYLSDDAIMYSKNYIAILSKDGYFKNTSSSLAKVLKYSAEELRTILIKNIIVDINFTHFVKMTNFYFENTIRCKNKSIIKIKWRLIPDAIDDAYVIVGWKLAP